MSELSPEEQQRRALAYPLLIEALLLTTRALAVADTPGAKHRVEASSDLLRQLGEPSL